MKHKTVSGIYAIRNLSEGHNYVGSSVSVHQRMDGHKSRLQKGKHHSKNLQADWIRLGEDNFRFEVIEEADLIALQDRENFWIDELKGRERYNSCRAAERRDMRYQNLDFLATNAGTIHVGQGVLMNGHQWEIEQLYQYKGMASAVLSRAGKKETIMGVNFRVPFIPLETV